MMAKILIPSFCIFCLLGMFGLYQADMVPAPNFLNSESKDKVEPPEVSTVSPEPGVLIPLSSTWDAKEKVLTYQLLTVPYPEIEVLQENPRGEYALTCDLSRFNEDHKRLKPKAIQHEYISSYFKTDHGQNKYESLYQVTSHINKDRTVAVPVLTDNVDFPAELFKRYDGICQRKDSLKIRLREGVSEAETDACEVQLQYRYMPEGLLYILCVLKQDESAGDDAVLLIQSFKNCDVMRLTYKSSSKVPGPEESDSDSFTFTLHGSKVNPSLWQCVEIKNHDEPALKPYSDVYADNADGAFEDTIRLAAFVSGYLYQREALLQMSNKVLNQKLAKTIAGSLQIIANKAEDD